MFGGNSNLPPGCSMRDIEEAFGGGDEPERWPVRQGLPLLLVAWENGHLHPPEAKVLAAMHETLADLDEWYAQAQEAAAAVIWCSMWDHAGDPRHEDGFRHALTGGTVR